MHRFQSICLITFMAVLGPSAFAQTQATVSDKTIVTADPSAGLSTGARELIRLADSGKDKAALMSYVTNSAEPFRLTANDVIYLRDVGIDTEIVTAMLDHDLTVEKRPSETTAEAPQNVEPIAEAPLVPTEDMTVTSTAPADVAPFYDSLAPYGKWVNMEGQGWGWQPNVAVADPGWQPYCDAGHWLWTDSGWYWASDYSWGWAPFHYGRWWNSPSWGWVWCPGQQWAPSWVTWRTYGDYCGWAPLPPGAAFVGTGFAFDNGFVGLNFGFGLSSDCFTFVEFPFFFHHDFRHHHLSHDHVDHFFHESSVVNNFRHGNNHGVVNNGVPVDRVRRETGRAIQPVPVVDTAHTIQPFRSTRFGKAGDLMATRTPLDTVPKSSQESFLAQSLPLVSKPIQPAVPAHLSAQQQRTSVNGTSTVRQQPTATASPTRTQTQSRTATTPATTNPRTGNKVNSVQAGPPLWNGQRNVPSNERQLWNGSSRENSLVLPSQQNPRGDLPTPTTPSNIREPAGAATQKAPVVRETQLAPSLGGATKAPIGTVTPQRPATAPSAPVTRSPSPAGAARPQSAPAISLRSSTQTVPQSVSRAGRATSPGMSESRSPAVATPRSAPPAGAGQIHSARPITQTFTAPRATIRPSAPVFRSQPSFSTRTFGSSPSQAFRMSAPAGGRSGSVGVGSSTGARGASGAGTSGARGSSTGAVHR